MAEVAVVLYYSGCGDGRRCRSSKEKKERKRKKNHIEGDGDVVDEIAVLVKVVVAVRRTWRYRGSICIA